MWWRQFGNLKCKIKTVVIASDPLERSNLVKMSKQYYVYIATNKINTVIYTGVTNNLARRMYEHKNKLIQGFSSKYNICKLMYYEVFSRPREAIAAEKKIKAGSRKKKIVLVESINPKWKDLSIDLS